MLTCCKYQHYVTREITELQNFSCYIMFIFVYTKTNNQDDQDFLYFQSEKALLYDSIKADLEDKIRRLEEDRHNIDISSGNLSWKSMHNCLRNKVRMVEKYNHCKKINILELILKKIPSSSVMC